MCIKLATAPTAAAGFPKAFERICVDLQTLRIVGNLERPAVSSATCEPCPRQRPQRSGTLRSLSRGIVRRFAQGSLTGCTTGRRWTTFEVLPDAYQRFVDGKVDVLRRG